MVGGIKPLWPNSHLAVDHNTAARHSVGDEANELVPMAVRSFGRLDVIELVAPECFLLELFPVPRGAKAMVDRRVGCHLHQALGNLVLLDELRQVQLGLIVPCSNILRGLDVAEFLN